MRREVLLVLFALVAAIGAASARAGNVDGTPPPTATTATGATTTTAGTTTTPSYAPLAGSRLSESCLGAGAVAVDEPGQRVLAFGAPASNLPASAYPADGSLVSFSASTASGSTCRHAHVTLSSVSLLGGAVTASVVEATDGRGRVTGLEIEGMPADATRGTTLLVAGWGELTLGADVQRLASPLVLRLLKQHDSLPAGTAIAVAFSAVSAPRPAPAQAAVAARSTKTHRHHHHKKHVPQPLKWTPRLGPSRAPYVFPVDGGASYVDTYGANRSDVYDGWHHGDDLFAPLGTPVVAVTKGRLSLIGWNRLGGWRLWLTDSQGNRFYYAHLAGYSRWILHHPHVAAGQVIGFLGRTGDAFTTTPHLHFEVHPHQLLKLKYDGAVDPTRYLRKWKVVHVPKQEIPQPARLVAPRGAPTQEAAVVWHQLLAARHLLPTHRPVALPAPISRPFLDLAAPDRSTGLRRIAAVRLSAPAGGQTGEEVWLAAGFAVWLFGMALGLLGVRRRAGMAAGPTPRRPLH